MDANNIEVGVIRDDKKGFHILTPSEVKEYMDELQ
jgi:20S proteasome alpha/beta subunit